MYAYRPYKDQHWEIFPCSFHKSGTHLVRRQVPNTLAEDRAREGRVERVLVRVRRGRHRLDERLAGQGALCAVVGAVVGVEDAHLSDFGGQHRHTVSARLALILAVAWEGGNWAWSGEKKTSEAR